MQCLKPKRACTINIGQQVIPRMQDGFFCYGAPKLMRNPVQNRLEKLGGGLSIAKLIGEQHKIKTVMKTILVNTALKRVTQNKSGIT